MRRNFDETAPSVRVDHLSRYPKHAEMEGTDAWNGGKNKTSETTIDDIGRLGVGLQLYFFTLYFLMIVFAVSNGFTCPHTGSLFLHLALAFCLFVLRR